MCWLLICKSFDSTQSTKTQSHHINYSKQTNKEAMTSNQLQQTDNINSLKRTNSRNLIARMNHRWSSSLRPRQDDVDEIVGGWHGGHVFEVVDGHDGLIAVGAGTEMFDERVEIGKLTVAVVMVVVFVLCCVLVLPLDGRSVAREKLRRGKKEGGGRFLLVWRHQRTTDRHNISL
jgi:hypothetical protein